MDNVSLETKRLTLRRFTESDVENLYELDNDPEVMRFINGATPTSRSVIEHKILPGFLKYASQLPMFGFWAITEKSSGNFLGWLSFRPTETNPNEASLGYRLRKNAWDKGYATEGAKALLERGFMEMGVERVTATTYEKNTASRRVMEKIGMKLIRRFRITEDNIEKSDTFHTASLELWDGDDVEYAIEKAEWERNQSKVK